MSKLLINEPPLQVLPTLAEIIGLQESIVLQQVNYWLFASKVEADGRKWVYNTLEEWSSQFPFWSCEAIRKIFKSLRDKGLITVRKLSVNTWNKTNYYTINEDRLDELMAQYEAAKSTASSGKTGRTDAVNSAASMRYISPVHITERSTETTTENVAAAGDKSPSTAAKKSRSKLTPGMQEARKKTWDSYCEGYRAKYGLDPIENPIVAGQLTNFIKRVGMADAPHIAGWFPSHKSSHYSGKGHTIGALLQDAEKLRTEWATGQQMTNTKARQQDRAGTTMSAVDAILSKRGEA